MLECKVLVETADKQPPGSRETELLSNGAFAALVERAVFNFLSRLNIVHNGVVVEFKTDQGLMRFQDGEGGWNVDPLERAQAAAVDLQQALIAVAKQRQGVPA